MTDGDVFLAVHRPYVDDGVGMYGSCEQWLPLLEHMLTDWKQDIMELGVAMQEVQYMLNEPVLI